MMRPGAKQQSYAHLGEALAQLPGDNWRLLVAGDGPARADIEHSLNDAAPGKTVFLGALDAPALAEAHAASDILV